jgi:hypothetical protein
MITLLHHGDWWFLARPETMSSAAKWNKSLHQTTPPIMNSFWTGNRWSFQFGDAQLFISKRRASEYLSVWLADMEPAER